MEAAKIGSTEEGSYPPGQTAYYHEDGEIDRVFVLENNSDNEWIKYKLRIEEVLQESRIAKPSEVGDIANVVKKRDMGGGCSGMWHLRDD